MFNIGRWVFKILGVGSRIRPWALGGTDQALGVGWHGPPFGRWVFKMPLAAARGGRRRGGGRRRRREGVYQPGRRETGGRGAIQRFNSQLTRG